VNTTKTLQHEPVLLQETVAMLNLKSGDIAIDCTAGGGGHSALILEQLLPNGRLYAIDRDLDAISHLSSRFAKEISLGQVVLEHTNFAAVDSVIESHNLAGKVNGICADLGVSSHHLDVAQRGFSFMKDGPLDMRMDQKSTNRSAADLVNELSERELSDIIFRFGEEPKARFIARAIVEARQANAITTTSALAELVAKAVHYKKPSRKHPATKTFQALRIAVNDELTEASSLIDKAFQALASGGRLGVITFHSLEDRLVKKRFASLSGKDRSNYRHELRHLPLTQPEWEANIAAKLIKPYPTYPSETELKKNPRARSAKLRVLEKH